MIKGLIRSIVFFLNDRHKPYCLNEALLAFAILALCFAIIFPDLFFLQLSPMGGSPSAIKDPAVSSAAFMPAFREFRYELFENGNILWSNLRGFGLPMLGNGVQGAPLFPLNLSLVWLPDSLYWSLMPILRVILIGLGTYLLARRVFGLSLIASLSFAFVAGFNLNVMRWINHPWQNGLLAGIWYTYFCCTLFININKNRPILFWHWLCLVVAVFGMITNGFPEASALAAIIAAFFFTAFIVNNWSTYKSAALKSITLIILAHVVGLSMSSVQVFALLEFIDVGAAIGLREGFSGGTYKTDDAIPYILSQFSHFWATPDLMKYLSFSIGLFGTFFLIRGLLLWFKPSNRSWTGVFCLLMMALFIVKAFGLSTLVESIFATVPVLAQSHFPLYFSPLFYFGAAYFAALGVENHLFSYTATIGHKVIDLFVSGVSALVVLLLCAWNISYFVDLPWFGLIGLILNDELRHFLFFIIGLSLLLSFQLLCLFNKFTDSTLYKKTPASLAVSTVIVICFIAEMSVSYFDQHASLDHWSLGLNNDLHSTFDQAVENSPYRRHELRSNDRNGDFVGYGIGTIDNGISAILPPDQRTIRLGLFQTKFGGYFPLDKSRLGWSWESLSSNLVMVSTTPKGKIDWSQYSPDPAMHALVDSWKPVITISRTEPMHLEGSISGFFEDTSDTRPWLHFVNESHDFWVKSNIAERVFLGKAGNRRKIVTKWRARVPNSWFKDDQYQMTVRLAKGDGGNYSDTPATTLNLLPIQPIIKEYNEYPNLVEAPLIAASPSENLHIYFNPNALPRAYVASRCLGNLNKDESLDFLVSSDAVLKGQISLEDTIGAPELDCDNYSAVFKRVPVDKDSGSQMTLANVTGPAIVAVNNYFYPGWKAVDEISGDKLTILKSNIIFRAVYLPESRDYKVKMVYQPWWLKIVYILLILSVCMILAVFRWLGSSQRKTV